VTDVLPAVAVAVQPPREGHLQRVTPEGRDSFDARLVRNIVRRGVATAAPSLVASLAAPAIGAPATAVAFASIVVTQLAQTLASGRRQGTVSRPVTGAVAGSGGVLAVALAAPPVRAFLGLPAVNGRAIALISATAPASVALSRL
jgi:hypothetical protein